MPMNRVQRGFAAALKAARRSQFYSHRVGAAVFIGAKLISLGYNRHKSHPKSSPRTCTQHAEFNSLIRLAGNDLSNAVLFVARLTRTNRVSCAKPCPDCQAIISRMNIRRVFYTNHDGQLEKLN